MFILSGGFSLISVSRGMVLVSALSAGSPGVEAAPLPAASVSPQSQPCLQPTGVTKDRCRSSAALEADRGWRSRKVPGEAAHQRTFYLFQLSQHLFPPVKGSFGYCCNLHPATPLPPSSLVPAPGSAGRDTSAIPILAGTRQAGQNKFRARVPGHTLSPRDLCSPTRDPWPVPLSSWWDAPPRCPTHHGKELATLAAQREQGN